jgi:hypothetical protein
MLNFRFSLYLIELNYKEIRDIFNIQDIPYGIRNNGKEYKIEKISLWRNGRKGKFDLFNTDEWKDIYILRSL